MAANKDIALRKLGEKIAQLRTSRGLNQTELAHLCNKDRQSINRLESGKINPSFYYLLQIADALKLPISELLDFGDC